MPHPILNETHVKEATELRAQNATVAQLASHFNVGHGAIRRFMIQHNVSSKHCFRKAVRFSLEHVKTAYSSGTTLTELCREYDCDYATLRKYMQLNGIERRTSWSRNTGSTTAVVYLPVEIKQRCTLMYNARESLSTIAKELRLTPSSIRKILRAEGIILRKPGPVANPAALKENVRRRTYGVAAGWYTAQLEKQSGGCAICGALPGDQRNRKSQTLAIDHRHNPHQVRGLLCHSCNLGIGHLKDSAEHLRKAAAYLDLYDAALVAITPKLEQACVPVV